MLLMPAGIIAKAAVVTSAVTYRASGIGTSSTTATSSSYSPRSDALHVVGMVSRHSSDALHNNIGTTLSGIGAWTRRANIAQVKTSTTTWMRASLWTAQGTGAPGTGMMQATFSNAVFQGWVFAWDIIGVNAASPMRGIIEAGNETGPTVGGTFTGGGPQAQDMAITLVAQTSDRPSGVTVTPGWTEDYDADYGTSARVQAQHINASPDATVTMTMDTAEALVLAGLLLNGVSFTATERNMPLGGVMTRQSGAIVRNTPSGGLVTD